MDDLKNAIRVHAALAGRLWAENSELEEQKMRLAFEVHDLEEKCAKQARLLEIFRHSVHTLRDGHGRGQVPKLSVKSPVLILSKNSGVSLAQNQLKSAKSATNWLKLAKSC